MTIITVEHQWSDENGPCYDCGDPAWFVAPDIYGKERAITSTNLFCAVCAVQHACDGERILRLHDEHPTEEHTAILAALAVVTSEPGASGNDEPDERHNYNA